MWYQITVIKVQPSARTKIAIDMLCKHLVESNRNQYLETENEFNGYFRSELAALRAFKDIHMFTLNYISNIQYMEFPYLLAATYRASELIETRV